jgi:anti-sigma regulatory factor (Ser/Thr protein kinase)
VSEALANVAKHAHASVVHVELGTPGAILQLTVRDDGAGGADPPPAPAAAALTPARAPARRGGQRSRPGITADSRHLLLLTGVR